MFRLLNKKGFTLVELMIVVVILGILVAIAVPVYSSVTRNAEKKTCFANMRMISGACVQYYMNHDTYAGLLDSTVIPDIAEASLPTEFIDKFDSVGIPHCPKGGAYKIERMADPNETTIKVTCVAKGTFEGHGEYH